MQDRDLLFLLISLMIICIYRMILSILFLLGKKYWLDEKYYISFFYVSLVGILVFFTDWFIAGCILLALTPVILTLYISFSPSRMYWIINGYELVEADFINKMIEIKKEYQDAKTRIKHFKVSRKIKEKRTKIEFLNVNYEEKKELETIVLNVLKDNPTKINKKEIYVLLGYGLALLVITFLILLTLFI